MDKEVFHRLRRKLAKIWLDINLQLTVVGVTGSYGKTGAVRAIASVLSSKFSVNQTDTNLDTVYSLPVTILKTRPWNEVLVLEYGIDHSKEMDYHLSLVSPKIAVLTGITSVHTDAEHLGSLDNLIVEKSKLFKEIPDDGLAVFNYDDEDSRKVGIKFKGRKIFYGLDKKANVWADKISISLAGTDFVIVDGKEKLNVKTGLIGYPAVYSCLAGYIVGSEFGVSKNDFLQRLSNLLPPLSYLPKLSKSLK